MQLVKRWVLARFRSMGRSDINQSLSILPCSFLKSWIAQKEIKHNSKVHLNNSHIFSLLTNTASWLHFIQLKKAARPTAHPGSALLEISHHRQNGWVDLKETVQNSRQTFAYRCYQEINFLKFTFDLINFNPIMLNNNTNCWLSFPSN